MPEPKTLQPKAAQSAAPRRLTRAARLACLAALPLALTPMAAAPALAQGDPVAEAPVSALPDEAPARIEVAFVLDTTGSMSGLIEGAKKKIWSIANNMMDLKPTPEIRFALIGYRDRGDDYVTRAFDLTDDVQKIYGELLAFNAAGGGDNPESVNQALHEAIADLAWSQEDAVFRTVFLVGDAPPHMDYQDDVKYQETLATAKARDIVVNAVQAGGQRETTKIWREIAELGGGSFAQIAQSGGMVAIETPYDANIEELNIKLQQTVVPYGEERAREALTDKLLSAGAARGGAAASMSEYFAKKSVGGARKVVSGGGDLVEDYANGEVDLTAVDDAALPSAVAALSLEERKALLAGRAAERASLRAKLDDLLAQRSVYLAEERARQALTPDAFDATVDALIESQAARKGFYK
ncbi:MAG: vWA domain-containing protein [Pseudomonadota bacterium]